MCIGAPQGGTSGYFVVHQRAPESETNCQVTILSITRLTPAVFCQLCTGPHLPPHAELNEMNKAPQPLSGSPSNPHPAPSPGLSQVSPPLLTSLRRRPVTPPTSLLTQNWASGQCCDVNTEQWSGNAFSTHKPFGKRASFCGHHGPAI